MIRIRYLPYLILLAFFITFTTTVIGFNNKSLVPLSKFMRTTNDKALKNIFGKKESATWEKSRNRLYKLGFANKNLLVKFVLPKEIDKKKSYFIEVTSSLVEKVDFYITDKHHKVILKKKYGNDVKFGNRDLYHPHPFLFLDEKYIINYNFYVRFKAKAPLSFDIVIWESDVARRKFSQESFWTGIYFGFALMVSIILFLYYVSLKEKSFLYLTFWLLFINLIVIILSGFGFQYLWPHWPLISFLILEPLIMLANIFGVLFFRQFSNRKDNKKLFYGHTIVIIVVFTLGYINVFSSTVKYVSIFMVSFLSMMTMFVISLVSYKNKSSCAKYLIWANLFLFIGIGIFAFRVFAVFHNCDKALIYFQIGVFLNTIFIILALLRRAKELNVKLNDFDFFKKIFDSMNETILVVDEKLNIAFVNNELSLLLGYTKSELQKLNFRDIISESSLLLHENPKFFENFDLIDQAEVKYLDKNGNDIPILFSSHEIHRGRNEKVILCFGLNLRDIKIAEIKIKETQKEVSEQRKYYKSILNKVDSQIFVIDRNLNYEYVNPTAVSDKRLAEKIIGKNDFSLCQELKIDISIAKKRTQMLEVVFDSGQNITYEENLNDKNLGRQHYLRILNPVKNEYDETTKIIGHAINITNRKRVEQQFEKLANTDELTQIPNRLFFVKELEKAFEEYKKNQSKNFALFFLDLDRFKIINDSLGHLIGDKLLVAIGKRLTKALFLKDSLVARFGGDEFTVLVKSFLSIDEIKEQAQNLLDVLNETYFIEKHEIITSSSIGIATSGQDYESPSQIIRDADLALYHAKSMGKARYQIFTEEMHKATVELQRLETNLRKTLDGKEFTLNYQPIIDLKTGYIKSFESLLRWRNKELGNIGPVDFIPLAEETGLIYAIGNWVMHEAARQTRRWQKIGFGHVRTAINISAKQFQYADFIKDYQKILRDTKISPESLEFELTETIVMGEDEVTLSVLKELAKSKVKFAVDDFGTGYSSFAYIKRFEIDTIKIDRSFIVDVAESETARSLYKSMIAMAKILNLKVTAEGIETKEQLDFVLSNNCDYAQGNYISTPLKIKDATKLLRKNKNYLSSNEK